MSVWGKVCILLSWANEEIKPRKWSDFALIIAEFQFSPCFWSTCMWGRGDTAVSRMTRFLPSWAFDEWPQNKPVQPKAWSPSSWRDSFPASVSCALSPPSPHTRLQGNYWGSGSALSACWAPEGRLHVLLAFPCYTASHTLLQLLKCWVENIKN